MLVQKCYSEQKIIFGYIRKIKSVPFPEKGTFIGLILIRKRCVHFNSKIYGSLI